jgi:hypothetical protein
LLLFSIDFCVHLSLSQFYSGMRMSSSIWQLTLNDEAWITGAVVILRFWYLCFYDFLPLNCSGSDFGVEAGASGACGIFFAGAVACIFAVSCVCAENDFDESH